MPICKKCNEKFPFKIRIEGVQKNLGNRKYCLDCSPWGEHNTKQIHEKDRKKGKCLNCENIVGRYEAKYCSSTCKSDFQYKLYIERWLKGLETGNIGKAQDQISNNVKRWLRETRGDKCERCGWKEVNPATGKVPVQAEHKDGDFQNTIPKNMELICPSCHSLTPTFGALNKGKGRRTRNKLKMDE